MRSGNAFNVTLKANNNSRADASHRGSDKRSIPPGSVRGSSNDRARGVEKNSKGCFHLYRGIEMDVPFESLIKVQFDMMNAVVDCVQNGVNGLIESPTGTGKTLSILCSAIATMRHTRRQVALKRE